MTILEYRILKTLLNKTTNFNTYFDNKIAIKIAKTDAQNTHEMMIKNNYFCKH